MKFGSAELGFSADRNPTIVYAQSRRDGGILRGSWLGLEGLEEWV